MTVPPYAFPESAVARMLKALVLGFKSITRANSYTCDMGDVFTEPAELGDIKNYPAVALIRGQTVIENEDQSDQDWHKRIPFLAMVYLKTDDPTWDRLRVLADIETMIGNNNMLLDEEGTETAREVLLEGDRPFGMVMNKPQVGFAFAFSVIMAQRINDASVTS